MNKSIPPWDKRLLNTGSIWRDISKWILTIISFFDIPWQELLFICWSFLKCEISIRGNRISPVHEYLICEREIKWKITSSVFSWSADYVMTKKKLSEKKNQMLRSRVICKHVAGLIFSSLHVMWLVTNDLHHVTYEENISHTGDVIKFKSSVTLVRCL